MKIQKKVISSFKAIELFEKEQQECDFIFNETPKSEKGKFIKYHNKHVVDLSTNCDYQSFTSKIFSSTIVLENNKMYYCDDSLITTMSSDEFAQLRYDVTLSNIYGGEKSTYYRMILPLDRELNLCKLFDKNYFCSDCGSSLGLIKTYVEEREFHIFKLSHNEKEYLFIDCLSEIEYGKFYDQSICILCALGILTGYFVENECFILSSGDVDFNSISYKEFRSLRESKYAPYKILPDNPYDFFPRKEAKDKSYFMAHIPTKVFTQFVNKISESLMLENSLFIFLEAISYPLDTQPACLSVVLEGLCNYVKDENEESVKPIQNKCKYKELIKRMKDLLNDYKDCFSSDGQTIIEKRIENINNPTNGEKFKKAIKILGLELQGYEEEALLNRNNFLHCTNELKTDSLRIKPDSQEHEKLFFASQILARLLYKMILKIIDYEGYIVNILKYNEKSFESIQDEDMLIKI